MLLSAPKVPKYDQQMKILIQFALKYSNKRFQIVLMNPLKNEHPDLNFEMFPALQFYKPNSKVPIQVNIEFDFDTLVQLLQKEGAELMNENSKTEELQIGRAHV